MKKENMPKAKQNEDKQSPKTLNKDASDFMLEEYKQIAKAFSDLYPEKDKLLKFYITLISISSTVLGALLILRYEKLSEIGITYIDLELGQIIGILFGILAIIGGLIMCSAIGLRIEMLTYARTINRVRRYFADKYMGIKDYLVLPIYDDKPPYFEKWNQAFIQEVIMLTFLNSILVTISLTLSFKISTEGWLKLIHVIILFGTAAIQLIIFWIICKSREDEFKVKFPHPKEE